MFDSNNAIQGGALSLIFSRVLFLDNSNITFVNNAAKSVDGAIYVQTYVGTVSRIPKCFYALKRINTVPSRQQMVWYYFSNNTATVSGCVVAEA